MVKWQTCQAAIFSRKAAGASYRWQLPARDTLKLVRAGLIRGTSARDDSLTIHFT